MEQQVYTYPDTAYISLEALDNRDYAQNDSRGFLAEYSEGVIIDEVKHAPELLNTTGLWWRNQPATFRYKRAFMV